MHDVLRDILVLCFLLRGSNEEKSVMYSATKTGMGNLKRLI